jgi:hypothetical protein
MLRKVRFFTGPCLATEVYNRAVKHGYTALEGTEHVYVNLEDKGDGWGVLESVDKFQKDIGISLRDAVQTFDIPL